MKTEHTVIGDSPQFTAALDHLSQLANVNRPILITGERGTGKEIAANRLHYLSPRWQEPFITLNCSALPENLIDSELFGYEPGAFTGAKGRHQGRFERANGGTLFLDELGTMPGSLQEKLLRVIEYGEFERLGGTTTIEVDVRLIAATNADLARMADEGKFRWDLLDRLTFDVVTMPALRDRSEDILPLSNHFAVKFAAECGWSVFPGFSESAVHQLMTYSWPGNVRELRNTVERSLHRHGSEELPIETIVINPLGAHTPEISRPSAVGAVTLPQDSNAATIPNDLRAALDAQEKTWLVQALEDSNWRQKDAALTLGINYNQIRGLMKKHALRTRASRSSG
jgi:psp operon transcriptional activator